MKAERKIIHVLMGVCLLFFSLILYLTHFEFLVKDKVISNPYNQRLNIAESNVLRGSIFDRNGEVLAKSQFNGSSQDRIYPFGSLYSHIIGYNSKIYGKILLEASFNDYLSNRYDAHVIMDALAKLEGYEPTGANLHLTIDHQLQVTAEKLMRNLKGAAVVMNPKTGEILAMVSKPDYSPVAGKLESNWKALVEDSNSPFLPRATQGLYAPGSTYKVVIASAALEKGMGDMELEDKGVITIDGKEFSNAGKKAYGKLDMKRALAVSSNTYFATLGRDLGFNNLRSIASAFGLDQSISFDLPLSKSTFPYSSMQITDMASVGIGQGKLLVTPLQMAMVASAIANDGVMMKPWLIQSIKTVNGITLVEGRPSQLFRSVSSKTAQTVKDMMVEVVEKGSGTNAKIKGVTVAGKTGTAQNELSEEGKGKEHAWFIGFAPAEDPQIAVAVIAEYSGRSGGDLCAPIAGKLMKTGLEKD